MKSIAGNTGELLEIPGVGPAMAKILHNLDIHSQQDLSGKDPEKLYHRYEQHIGHHVDRCVLYVFRCAVYFSETPEPDPELLKWWNWKDKH
jgi:hypothetical protein